MAKRISIASKESQLLLIGPKNSIKASRIQRASLAADVPSTTVDELGNSAHVGNVNDVPNVTLTFSAFDVGVKTFSVLTGTDWTAYPAGGVDISNLSTLDAAIFTKDPSVSDYVKSVHARNLQVRDLAFSYSTDGEATEDYTAVGSERRYLRYDVVVDRYVAGTTSFTLTQTPIQLKNSNYALSAILDGAYLTEVSTAPATGEYRVVGTTVTTGDTRNSQLIMVYHANPGGSNWSDISDAGLPIAVRGKDNLVYIAANNIPRVQSITINASVNLTPVREMGNRQIVGYTKQVPTVEGTITVLDTDNELVNLFDYGTTTISGYEWQPGEGCATSGISMSVRFADPCDTTVPYTVLKEVYLDSIVPVGDTYTLNVNNAAQLAINYRSTTGHLVVYSGAKA